MSVKLNFELAPMETLTLSPRFYQNTNPTSSIASSISSSISSSSSTNSTKVIKGMSCFQTVDYFFNRLISNIHFFFHSFFYATIDHSASIEKLKEIYNGLGSDKWKECIDAKYHHLGKDVFKLGLHGGCIEPEYVPSMEASFKFCEKYLNKKVDADWYLQLHQITCGHFDGDEDVYLMAQDRVGVFRDSDDNICWYPSGTYEVNPEAQVELKALDEEISREFGPKYGMGSFAVDSTTRKVTSHSYLAMGRRQIKVLFTKFLNEFYAEVEQAPNRDKKLEAIAKLNKRLELLHPVRDGSGRTNTAFINKILTEYGFHPVLLDNPFFQRRMVLSAGRNISKQAFRNGKLRKSPETFHEAYLDVDIPNRQ